MELSRCLVAVLLSCAPVAGPPAVQKPPVNREAQVLQDFRTRVDSYLALHKKLQRRSPPLEPTKDPAKIEAAQDALAAKIREARAGARQGDVFTPDVARVFRKLMYPELKGPEAKDTKGLVRDVTPTSIVLKVNAAYPENQPLPTVPPNLLAALPQLPKELEYRIVNNALILRDVPANLIVDYIPNAVRVTPVRK